MKRQKNKKAFLSREERSVGDVRLAGAGILALVSAFVLLRLANPAGDNCAAHASPFIFIISWAMIIAGILHKEEADNR